MWNNHFFTRSHRRGGWLTTPEQWFKSLGFTQNTSSICFFCLKTKKRGRILLNGKYGPAWVL